MKNMYEMYSDNYVSRENYKAEDSKPFEFSIVVETTDLNSACGETGFLVCVEAVKLPKYLTKEQRKSVASCMSIKPKEISPLDIAQYGISAPLESFTVANESELAEKLAYIDNQLPAYGMLCGFYFDKTVNRVGNTGWDFLNGKIN
jgi:hypothetical protein